MEGKATRAMFFQLFPVKKAALQLAGIGFSSLRKMQKDSTAEMPWASSVAQARPGHPHAQGGPTI